MKKLSEQIMALRNETGELVTTLDALNQQLNEQSIAVFIILLSFPSALPVPAPGYSTPFGIILMWISTLLIRNHKQMQLPQKWRHKPFKLSAKTVRIGLMAIRFLEKFVHPQRATVCVKWLHRRLIGLNLLLLAFIMALPIPLTNTVPAANILLFGLGMLENDGMVLLLAQMLAMSLISLYGFVAIWGTVFGIEKLQQMLHYLHVL